jgi:hypothetical protein
MITRGVPKLARNISRPIAIVYTIGLLLAASLAIAGDVPFWVTGLVDQDFYTISGSFAFRFFYRVLSFGFTLAPILYVYDRRYFGLSETRGLFKMLKQFLAAYAASVPIAGIIVLWQSGIQATENVSGSIVYISGIIIILSMIAKVVVLLCYSSIILSCIRSANWRYSKAS